jgi:pSer/pThr/pTyr-binding forkhead associated (FHA) protein
MADQHNSPTEQRLGRPDEAITTPGDTYLIMENAKVFIINLPITSLGRRFENTIVLDDPRVSRSHAQLRLINGQYVLFDLNSTGGTFINGQRITQSTIYSGDTISLAGVKMIFKQNDAAPRPDLVETSPF